MGNYDEDYKSSYGYNSKGSLTTFLIGIVVFGIGAYMVLQNTTVSTSFGLSFLGKSVPTGVMIMPILIGIVMLFFNEKSILGWILFVGGILLILVGIIMGLRIYFHPVSTIEAIIMYGMVAAGIGLTLKGLFGKN